MAEMKETGEDSSRGNEPQKKSVKALFSRVKDRLNFTKHLGFQSGPDSLANQEALTNARERKAREAEQEKSSDPGQVGPSDRVAAVVHAFGGGVVPSSEQQTLSPIPEKSPKYHGERIEESEKKRSEDIKFDTTPPHSPAEPASPTEKNKDAEESQSKKSEKSSWSWLAHKAHQVARAAASKDLSDELLKKDANEKTSK